MEGNTRTATGSPSTYRSPQLERRRRATIAVTVSQAEGTESNESLDLDNSIAYSSSKSRKSRLSFLGSKVSSFFASFEAPSLFTSSALSPTNPDSSEGVDDSSPESIVAETLRNRGRSASVQRVAQRLSKKINSPALSHASYLQSANSSPKVIPAYEFYHADFSKKEEGGIVGEGREDVRGKERIGRKGVTFGDAAKKGNMFVEAMSLLAAGARGADGDNQKRINPRTSTSSISISLPLSQTPPPPATVSTATSSKKVSTAPQIGTLDVSDLFPQTLTELTSTPGLTLFRIENMRPTLLPTSDHGRFCIADCYLVISTTTDDPHLQRYDQTGEKGEMSTDHLVHTIYTWIGSRAEMDKRFCCAMFAVGVKQLLPGARGGIVREAEGEEEDAFLEVFEGVGGILYEDEEVAAESGLFVAERRRFQVKVYEVFVVKGGRGMVRMRVVEPVKGGLRSDGVYFVDAGWELVQWNGRESRSAVRAKCRLLIDVVNGADRAGRAKVFEVEEGDVCEVLERVLPDVEVSADEEVEVERTAVLYKVPSDGTGELSNWIVSREENESGFSRSMLDPQDCFILDAGAELFLWIGSKASAAKKSFASEVLAKVIRQSYRPSYLSLQRITHHNEPEPFKLYFPDWVEPRTESLTQSIRRKLAPVPFKVDVRALYAPHPLLTGNASVIHQDRFFQAMQAMQEANEKLVQYTAFAFERGRFVRLEDFERGGVHVCMEGQYAFLAVYGGDATEQVLEEDVRGVMNGALVLQRDEEFKLGGEKFPVVDSYFSLALKKEEPTTRHCVIYFWVGRYASNVAEKSFRFHARKELEDAVRGLYGCDVNVVHVTQEREPVELLAHWGNRSVIHRGTRRQLLKRVKEGCGPVLYHVRTDWRFKTTRAVEVSCASERLVSRDCFYVGKVGGEGGFLWTGKNSTLEDGRKACSVADRITSFYGDEESVGVGDSEESLVDTVQDGRDESVQEKSIRKSARLLVTKKVRIVAEGLEPRAFWEVFPNGKQPYCTGPMPPLIINTGIEGTVVPTNLPRLLVCSCVKGYFSVEELPQYDQLSLDTSCCAILDPGPHSPVYLWQGSSASDVVIKLSKKAVEVWLETLDDGRRNWEGELATGEVVVDGVISAAEGAESYEFRSMFLGWVQVE